MDELVAQFVMASAMVYHVRTPRAERSWQGYDNYHALHTQFANCFGERTYKRIADNVYSWNYDHL